MNPLLGTLNDHPLMLPEFNLAPSRPVSLQRELGKQLSVKEGAGPNTISTSILRFPYLSYLHTLLEQGRIREAHTLFEFAKDLIPQDAKIREALAPPRMKASAKKGVDRSAEFRWLDLNSARFRGKWVALLGESLAASADSLKELLGQLGSMQLTGKPLVHHID